MIAERVTKLSLSFAAVLLATGCAGARTTVVADTSKYPVSLSRGVRDADGVIASAERTKKVGSLHGSSTAWGLLYSAVRLTPKTDISSLVNDQIAAAGGDAVVNLRIHSSHCASDFFAILTTLPVWPGCANIAVEGDIVKVLPPPTPRDAEAAR